MVGLTKYPVFDSGPHKGRTMEQVAIIDPEWLRAFAINACDSQRDRRDRARVLLRMRDNRSGPECWAIGCGLMATHMVIRPLSHRDRVRDFSIVSGAYCLRCVSAMGETIRALPLQLKTARRFRGNDHVRVLRHIKKMLGISRVTPRAAAEFFKAPGRVEYAPVREYRDQALPL